MRGKRSFKGALRSPAPDSFDVRPASVREWIDAMPLGDRGESVRRIYSALIEVNELEVPVKHRFEFLEQIGQPVSGLIPAMNRHFATQGFPLPPSARKMARLSTEMQRSLYQGYQRVLDREAGSSWLYRKRHQRLWAVAIHRMLHYLGGIIRNLQLLNMPVSAELWREVHGLYAMARDNGRLETVVFGPENTEIGTTIQDEYKKILLLSLLSPHRLSPRGFEEVYRTSEQWLGAVSLAAAESEALEQFSYVMSISGDGPPRSVAYGSDEPVSLGLDCRALKESLRRALNQGRAERTGVPDLSTETIRALIATWCRPPARQELRVASIGDVEVAVGLTRLIRTVAAGVPPRLQASTHPPSSSADSAEAGDDAQFEELDALGLDFEGLDQLDRCLEAVYLEGEDIGFDLGDDGMGLFARPENAFRSERECREDVFLATGEHSQEAWKRFFFGDDQNSHGDWLRESLGVRADYQPETCIGKITDRSPNGFALWLPREDELEFRAGDVVGVREPGSRIWQAGLVRWLLTEEAEGFRAGLCVVMRQVIPVIITVCRREGDSGPIQALLGTCNDGEIALLLPHLPGLSGTTLVLDYLGHRANVRLRRRLADSPHFDVYRFEEQEDSSARTKSVLKGEGQ